MAILGPTAKFRADPIFEVFAVERRSLKNKMQPAHARLAGGVAIVVRAYPRDYVLIAIFLSLRIAVAIDNFEADGAISS